MRNSARGIFVLMLLGLLHAGRVLAQLDSSHVGCESCLWRVEHVKGTWKYDYDASLGVPRMTPVELQSLRGTLAAIADIAHAAPVMAKLDGINATVWARLTLGCPFHQEVCHWKTLGAWEEVLVDMHLINVQTGKRYIMNQESPRVHIAVNDPTEIYIYGGHRPGGFFDDGGNEIIGEPQKVGEVDGFTLYDNQLVVVASKPLFVPVSREQYVRAVIRAFAKKAKDDGTEDELAFLVGPLQKELESMGAEERRSQAFSGRDYSVPSGLTTPTGYAATPMVTFNPDFFDSSLPRTAVQLITVRTQEPTEAIDTLPDNFDARTQSVWALRQTIDYHRLAGLLATHR